MNQVQKHPPLARSVVEAARSLGVGRSTIYELIGARELRCFKIGTRTLIAEAELQRFISARSGALA